MNFIKESADKKPIVDTVFAIVAKAKEATEARSREILQNIERRG